MLDHPEYVAARQALLDALEALEDQIECLVLVGAQAVYLRTAGATVPMAPYTTDADLAIDPRQLGAEPLLTDLLRSAQIRPDERANRKQPGMWVREIEVDGTATPVPVEFLVPEGLAPPGGTRSVDLGRHGDWTARRTIGLEACVVDSDVLTVRSLSEDDDREVDVSVAGPAGLLVAKLFKLHDRLEGGRRDRQSDKDAADVYRLFLATGSSELAHRYETTLSSEVSRDVAQTATELARSLFTARRQPGIAMAAMALPAVPEDRILAVCRHGVDVLAAVR